MKHGWRELGAGCRVLVSGARVLGALVLGALVLGALVLGATTLGAQGRFTNAKAETRSAAQGLEREIRAIEARGGVSWIGYRVPMIPGPRQMCCYDSVSSGDNTCCGMCRLEGSGGLTMNTGDAAMSGSRITLEPPSEFLVLIRIEGGAVSRLRTFTPDCDVDAGGMPVVWFSDVKPDESVAWLASLTRSTSGSGSNNPAKQAVHAIAMHNTPSALDFLLRTAKTDADTRRRSDALFWLSQRAGREAVAAITNAIDNDPETEVKKKAVFALSQLPEREGVPKLIEIARTHRNPEVRKQAFFWLGQTKDPRAIQFFEEILLKRQ